MGQLYAKSNHTLVDQQTKIVKNRNNETIANENKPKKSSPVENSALIAFNNDKVRAE